MKQIILIFSILFMVSNNAFAIIYTFDDTLTSAQKIKFATDAVRDILNSKHMLNLIPESIDIKDSCNPIVQVICHSSSYDEEVEVVNFIAINKLNNKKYYGWVYMYITASPGHVGSFFAKSYNNPYNRKQYSADLYNQKLHLHEIN